MLSAGEQEYVSPFRYLSITDALLQTHAKAVIKEGERIHYFALQKQAAAATATPAERELLRVVTPHGTRELIEADLKPAGHH
jgi:hypothetical protein